MKRIEEVWIWNPGFTESLSAEWIPMTVLSINKQMVIGRQADGMELRQEILHVAAYHETTGEIVEVPLNEVIIKRLYNEESKKFVDFSAPAQKEGEEDR